MTARAGEGFPKAARVRRRREYLTLGRTARRVHVQHFVLLFQPRSGPTRLGITVTKKIGGAVERNRVKRRVREAFRRDPHRLLEGHDLIVIAKPGATALASADVARELATAARRSGPTSAAR
jgi:ribonuclease P protein component